MANHTVTRSKSHLCRAWRSAAVKFSPETVRESCHGKCREVSGDILLLLVPQEAKLKSAQNFSRLISWHFSRDVLQLQIDFMAFSTLQTFVLYNRFLDATCLLTVGSFLLTVELFDSQLTILEFLLTTGAFSLTIFGLFYLQLEFLFFFFLLAVGKCVEQSP